MGSGFDEMTELSHPRLEARHLASGALTREQHRDRELLREALARAASAASTTSGGTSTCSTASTCASTSLESIDANSHDRRVRRRLRLHRRRLRPLSEGKISLFDWGFTRSDATYDVASAWRGAFFRLDAHLDRFFASLAKLRMRSRTRATRCARSCTAAFAPAA